MHRLMQALNELTIKVPTKYCFPINCIILYWLLQFFTFKFIPCIKYTSHFCLLQILFQFDRSSLEDEAIEELNRIAEAMLEQKSYKLEMIGHTDSYGREGYNLELSEKRAYEVIEYLASRGIDRSRLMMTWKGESEPASSNLTASGRQENRRVEFKIYEMSYETFSEPQAQWSKLLFFCDILSSNRPAFLKRSASILPFLYWPLVF